MIEIKFCFQLYNNYNKPIKQKTEDKRTPKTTKVTTENKVKHKSSNSIAK